MPPESKPEFSPVSADDLLDGLKDLFTSFQKPAVLQEPITEPTPVHVPNATSPEVARFQVELPEADLPLPPPLAQDPATSLEFSGLVPSAEPINPLQGGVGHVDNTGLLQDISDTLGDILRHQQDNVTKTPRYPIPGPTRLEK